MPNKTSRKKVAAPELPSIPKELIEPFVSGSMTAEAVNAVSIERALGAELTHPLGCPAGGDQPATVAAS